ncbi:hypothetical protein [Zemynaea arenosa]|uniref:hypothetical protein n=1 Tax=Zemynaea arenosa TaxID=2561931 RepID=UPI001E55B6A7|nr:hypothetical protein [Massilia arenosa]
MPFTFRRVVQASAWYDLIVTAGFATPWTFAIIHGLLQQAAAGLPGTLPPFEPAHMLMANLLGSIVVVWALLRLHEPRALYGRFDAAGRVLFAAWQLYAVAHGASVLVLGFTVVEIGFGIVQMLPLRWFADGGAADQQNQYRVSRWRWGSEQS